MSGRWMAWGTALAMLAMGGCGPGEGPPIWGTLRIEETGAEVPVADVVVARSLDGSRAAVFFVLTTGEQLAFDFATPASTGELPLFVPAPAVAPARAWLADRDHETVCSADAATEGTLSVRHVAYSSAGYVSELEASLTVRFTSCPATFAGAPAASTTFVLGIPGE